jgi:hypothetical protein
VKKRWRRDVPRGAIFLFDVREEVFSPSWPGKSAKRVFAQDDPAIHALLADVG